MYSWMRGGWQGDCKWCPNQGQLVGSPFQLGQSALLGQQFHDSSVNKASSTIGYRGLWKRQLGKKQEGNVLRNLRPSMFQMLMGKMLHSLVQISVMSLCPWCPNQGGADSLLIWIKPAHRVRVDLILTEMSQFNRIRSRFNRSRFS